ncbi:MAG: hypothetical protein A3K68_04510 [Euryarchaeota archaeon RBG_16_68_13]|nr:MAG: hypothetical protein A3K68_04510 [Euryarchaeota archaeon RBG_16_68_13]
MLDGTFWFYYFRFFRTGLFGTLGYVAFIIPVSALVGFLTGWARVSRHRVLVWPAAVFVDFFRGIPQLIMIIFAFLFAPDFIPQPIMDRLFANVPLRDISVNAAAFVLALHSGAYQAEIFRAGFQSVPKGQLEAAQALGMRGWQSMRDVVLPQALRLSLPPLGNEFAVVIKDTSLLAAIAGAELFGKSTDFRGVLAISGFPLTWMFAVLTVIALIYFFMTFTVTRILLVLERRYSTPGLEAMSI